MKNKNFLKKLTAGLLGFVMTLGVGAAGYAASTTADGVKATSGSLTYEFSCTSGKNGGGSKLSADGSTSLTTSNFNTKDTYSFKANSTTWYWWLKGYDAIDSVTTVKNTYPGNGGVSLKVGKSKEDGTISFTPSIPDGSVIDTVVLTYNTTKATKLAVSESDEGTVSISGAVTGAESTFTYTQVAGSEKTTVTVVGGNGSTSSNVPVYVTKIVVNYKDNGPAPEPEVTGVTLTASSQTDEVTLYVNQQETFTVGIIGNEYLTGEETVSITGLDVDDFNNYITTSPSDLSSLKNGDTFSITAIAGEGIGEIKAQYGTGASAITSNGIAIYTLENSQPHIVDVTITKSSSSVKTHESITVSAKVEKENDDQGTLSTDVTWTQSSSDGGAVTFSKSTSSSEENITITGSATGTVTIQATSSADNSVSDSFLLTVGKNIIVTGVTITGGNINKTSGYIGDTQDLSATVSYQYEEGLNTVTWESSQPTVVSIDQTGKIKFLANTTSAVTITATSVENTEKSGSISVTASNLVEEPQIAGLKNGHKYFILSSGNAILTAKAVNTSHSDYIDDYKFNQGKNKPFTSTATVTSGKVTAISGVEESDLGEYAFTFTKVEKNQWKISNGTNAIGNGDANNGMSMNDSTGLVYTCSESSSTGGNAAKDGFYNLKSNRYITYYSGGPDWRTYSNLDNGDPNLYFIEYIAPVKPNSLSLDINEWTFTTNSGSKTITPTVLGPNGGTVTTQYDITWTSDNSSIASVSEGVITAKSAGTTTIRASIPASQTYSGVALSATVEVTVRTFKLDYTGATLLSISDTVNLGNCLSVSPAFASTPTYSWSSSDSSKMSVTSAGLATALAETDSVSITVTTTVSGYTYTDSVSFEIKNKVVEATEVRLSKYSSSLVLGGSPDEITATVYGENDELATSQEITISGSYSSIVSVSKDSNNKLTISPAAVGNTTIYVNFAGGTDATKKSISVTVSYAPITSFVLSSTTTEIYSNQTLDITATVNQYASLEGIKFSVSPAGVATVSHLAGKAANVYTLQPTDTYVGGTVTVSATIGQSTSNPLEITIIDYLNYIGYKPILPAQDVTATYTATSGGMGTTTGATFDDDKGNTWTITRSSVVYTGWMSGYVQFGSSSGAEELTLTTSDIKKKVKSVSVDCSSYNNSSSVDISVGSTVYLSSTSTAKWSETSVLTGNAPQSGAVSGTIQIHFSTGSRAKYIKQIVVVYEGEETEGEEINISNTDTTVQQKVVQYAKLFNSEFAKGNAHVYDNWSTLEESYESIVGSLTGSNLDLASYMYQHANYDVLGQTQNDCLQACVKSYDSFVKQFGKNDFLSRSITPTTYNYSIEDNNADSVTGGTEEGSYVYNTPITLPTSVSRNGYQFDGWYTSETFESETKLTSGFSMPDHNVTIYAHWLSDSYEYAIEANGGSYSGGTEEGKIARGAAVTLPTSVSKTGYIFDGWYTSPSFTEASKVTTGFNMPDYDVTIYAKWLFDDEALNNVTSDIGMSYKYTDSGKDVVSTKGVNDEATKYELVKDTSKLKAGDEILIVGIENDAYYALAPWKSGDGNCKRNDVALSGDGTIETNVASLTLGGSSGAWTLNDGTYYLYEYKNNMNINSKYHLIFY